MKNEDGQRADPKMKILAPKMVTEVRHTFVPRIRVRR